MSNAEKAVLKLALIIGKQTRIIEELIVGHPNKVRLTKAINDIKKDFDGFGV